jgi:hypothetical protein
MAGWVVLSRWAAPRKLPSVTAHRNVSSDLKSTITWVPNHYENLSTSIKNAD